MKSALNTFKRNWEISKNWQLLYPFIGIIALVYCSIKLSLLFNFSNYYLVGLIATTLFFGLLLITLWIFRKLRSRWEVSQRWELIRIFIVFALTGSSSVVVSRPIIELLGINKENLNIFLYYILFIFVSLVVYQILLVAFGWLFCQFNFFWNFEKKMLRKLGFKKLID